jgi:hypothetical protein
VAELINNADGSGNIVASKDAALTLKPATELSSELALSAVQQMAQDLFEDALLMEVSEAQIRAVLHRLVDELVNPYGQA